MSSSPSLSARPSSSSVRLPSSSSSERPPSSSSVRLPSSSVRLPSSSVRLPSSSSSSERPPSSSSARPPSSSARLPSSSARPSSRPPSSASSSSSSAARLDASLLLYRLQTIGRIRRRWLDVVRNSRPAVCSNHNNDNHHNHHNHHNHTSPPPSPPSSASECQRWVPLPSKRPPDVFTFSASEIDHLSTDGGGAARDERGGGRRGGGRGGVRRSRRVLYPPSCAKSRRRREALSAPELDHAVLLLAFFTLVFGLQIYNAIENLDDHVERYDVRGLAGALRRQLHGQDAALAPLCAALAEFLAVREHGRPLLLSLHGAAGVGKSVAGRVIERHFRALAGGAGVALLHRARSTFGGGVGGGGGGGGDDGHVVSRYLADLNATIAEVTREAEGAQLIPVFIFDDVEEMPAAVLDFLHDRIAASTSSASTSSASTSWSTSWYTSSVSTSSERQQHAGQPNAIYILISSLGHEEIMAHALSDGESPSWPSSVVPALRRWLENGDGGGDAGGGDACGGFTGGGGDTDVGTGDGGETGGGTGGGFTSGGGDTDVGTGGDTGGTTSGGSGGGKTGGGSGAAAWRGHALFGAARLVPLSPLRELHVRLCVRDEMLQEGLYPTEGDVRRLAGDEEYVGGGGTADEGSRWAVRGCKGVAAKVNRLQ